MRWEVKTIHGPTDASHAADQVPVGIQIAELLDQGWEPFGVLDRGTETWVFLKRCDRSDQMAPKPITSESRRREKAFLQQRRRVKKGGR